MTERRHPTAGLEEIAAEYDGGRLPLGQYAGFMGVYTAAFLGAVATAHLARRPIPRLGWADVALLGTATHKLSRLISASAFQLKGTGWYVTDYAKKGPADQGKDGEKKEPEKKDGEKAPDKKGSGAKAAAATAKE